MQKCKKIGSGLKMILDLEQSQIRFKQPVKPADPDDVEDVGNPQLDDSDIKSIQDLVPDLISMMEAVGRREDFVKKIKIYCRQNIRYSEHRIELVT